MVMTVEEAPAAVDRVAIREARAVQNAAMVAGNVDRVASFWTDDVTMRRGFGLAVNGKAEYRTNVTPSGSRDSVLVYKRETTDVETSAQWPLAFETGTWSAHEGTIAAPAIITGRYSAQWVKRAGRWLIRSEVFVALGCTGKGCAMSAQQ
jgi:ketosteroid isomerase-like protein